MRDDDGAGGLRHALDDQHARKDRLAREMTLEDRLVERDVLDARSPTSSPSMSMIRSINLINLLPVYPLDGGQLLNRIFLDEESWISKGFVILSAALMCYIAWRLDFYVLLIFPVMMLLRLKGDHQFDDIEKKIEDAGINADVAYGDMPDADYWKIRNIVIENHPPFRDVPLAPPYNYDKKEEKIMTTIQGLLHRHLIQDVSIVGKCFLVLIWLAAFGVPWFLQLDMSVFHRFIF